MFNLLTKRKLANKWEQLLADGTTVRRDDAKIFTQKLVDISQQTMLHFPSKVLNKKSLRAMTFLKRVLADKGMYDHIKIIDYVIGGHNACDKISSTAKQQVVAHFCQMASLYCNTVINNQQSNPLIPTEILKPREEDND